MPHIIQLNHMDPSERSLIASLLRRDDTVFWSKDTTYDVFDKDLNKNVEIQLSHSIYSRARNATATIKHPEDDKRFEVIDHDQCLGKGSFGEVYLLAGTLAFQEDGLAKFKLKTADKVRVVKILQLLSISAVNNECRLSQDAGQLHTKDATVYGNIAYITSRKAPGQLLADIMQEDELTLKERYLLSCALLNAAKIYLHDKGILHQDLKPQNIYVDMSDLSNIIITFLDFGTSCKLNDINPIFGTPPYEAPEKCKYFADTNTFVISDKIDVFALGRILAQLWHDAHFNRYYMTIAVHGSIGEENLIPALFHNLLPIPSAIQRQLTSCIIATTQLKPGNRVSFSDAINIIEAIDFSFCDELDHENKQYARQLLNSINSDCSAHQKELAQHYGQLLAILNSNDSGNRYLLNIYNTWFEQLPSSFHYALTKLDRYFSLNSLLSPPKHLHDFKTLIKQERKEGRIRTQCLRMAQQLIEQCDATERLEQINNILEAHLQESVVLSASEADDVLSSIVMLAAKLQINDFNDNDSSIIEVLIGDRIDDINEYKDALNEKFNQLNACLVVL